VIGWVVIALAMYVLLSGARAARTAPPGLGIPEGELIGGSEEIDYELLDEAAAGEGVPLVIPVLRAPVSFRVLRERDATATDG